MISEWLQEVGKENYSTHYWYILQDLYSACCVGQRDILWTQQQYHTKVMPVDGLTYPGAEEGQLLELRLSFLKHVIPK